MWTQSPRECSATLHLRKICKGNCKLMHNFPKWATSPWWVVDIEISVVQSRPMSNFKTSVNCVCRWGWPVHFWTKKISKIWRVRCMMHRNTSTRTTILQEARARASMKLRAPWAASCMPTKHPKTTSIWNKLLIEQIVTHQLVNRRIQICTSTTNRTYKPKSEINGLAARASS